MKKILCISLAAVTVLAAKADEDWMTMLGKSADLAKETGMVGFMKRDAPAYITGKFVDSDLPEKKAYSVTETAITMPNASGTAAILTTMERLWRDTMFTRFSACLMDLGR